MLLWYLLIEGVGNLAIDFGKIFFFTIEGTV